MKAHPQITQMALGLLLAAVGIYGVMAFAVAQRTHEFGMRMALGAQRTRVVNMVLKEGAMLAICGSVIGLSVASGRVEPLDALRAE